MKHEVGNQRSRLLSLIVALLFVSCFFVNSSEAEFSIGSDGTKRILDASGQMRVSSDTWSVASFQNTGAVNPGDDQTSAIQIVNAGSPLSTWVIGVGGLNNGLGLNNGHFYLESLLHGVPLVIDTLGNTSFYTYNAEGDPSTSCVLFSGSSGWSCTSDRNLKENFSSVDGREILKQLSSLPVMKWNIKGSSIPHIGPVAQDFYSAFHVGSDDKKINSVDSDGVALAAIQGLYQITKEQEKIIKEQETEILSLKKAMLDIAIRLASIESSNKTVAAIK